MNRHIAKSDNEGADSADGDIFTAYADNGLVRNEFQRHARNNMEIRIFICYADMRYSGCGGNYIF